MGKMVKIDSVGYNLNANTIIALNGTAIKSSEMEEIKEKLKNGYSGSDNAGKTLLINNTNSEGKVEITKLDNDKTTDLYKSVQESSVDDLYVAFRINPILLGINVATGFSRIEFVQAYTLYKFTTVNPIRQSMTRAFASIGIDVTYKDFNFEFPEE